MNLENSLIDLTEVDLTNIEPISGGNNGIVRQVENKEYVPNIEPTLSPVVVPVVVPVVSPVVAEYDEKTGVYTFPCPHCEHFVEVGRNEVNCTIFRHGYFFSRVGHTIVLTSQMNPHTPKEECDRLVGAGLIYGCGKPFRMVREGDGYVVVKCDYI